MSDMELIFDRLAKWKKYPNYQFERRIDIYFGVLIPEIFKNLEKGKRTIRSEDIFPEFPISNNSWVDFLCFDENKKPLFIELKTDDGSIKPKQIDNYKLEMDHRWPHFA